MKSMQDEVMACSTFVELVTEYLEQALPGEQRARFEQHLHFCEGCVTYLEQIRATSQIVHGIGVVADATAAPIDIEPLVSAFRRWKESQGL